MQVGQKLVWLFCKSYRKNLNKLFDHPIKPTGYSENSSKREVCSDTSLPQGTREISNKQSKTLHLKQQDKEAQLKPKVSRRKEVIKISHKNKWRLKKKTEKKSMN